MSKKKLKKFIPVHLNQKYIWNGGCLTGYKILSFMFVSEEAYNQKAIAYIIDSSVSNVCRALKRLTNEKYLVKENGKYYINSGISEILPEESKIPSEESKKNKILPEESKILPEEIPSLLLNNKKNNKINITKKNKPNNSSSKTKKKDPFEGKIQSPSNPHIWLTEKQWIGIRDYYYRKGYDDEDLKYAAEQLNIWLEENPTMRLGGKAGRTCMYSALQKDWVLEKAQKSKLRRLQMEKEKLDLEYKESRNYKYAGYTENE